jgi:energy-coupling factor transporter ATP-binding protein EcfA2
LTKHPKVTNPIVVCQNVSFQYPNSNRYALKNLNLEVHKGEFLGLIGPTGAGKTTLCLAMNGIVPQFYTGRFFGSIKITGMDTVEHPIFDFAKLVGMVFDDPATQLITISAENEIAFPLENLKIPREIIINRINKVLAAVRLGDKRKKHPQDLSGGEKQRLSIAAAIAIQPKILVLDEPTSQLDPVGTEEIFSTIKSLNKDLGITIIMASHSAEEISEFADRIALISQGEVQAIGTPDEIYTNIESLEKNHLRPPQVTSIFHKLSKRGISIPRLPVKMQDTPLLIEQLRGKPFKNIELKKSLKNNKKPLIEVNSLTYNYPDGTQALNNVSMDINSGDFVLIIGQNGAGKSTLVKNFINLLQPSSGMVKFDGVPTNKFTISELARKIGYISQNPDNQIFNRTVESEIAYALEHWDLPLEERTERTNGILEDMNLVRQKSRHPLSLPKGDRARVVIAAALALNPDVLIFDEPTTGQDFEGAKQILDIAKKLHLRNKTIIVVTHHLYLMPNYADRVVVMGKGTILLDSSIRDAFHQIDILKKTYIYPPQAVIIAKEIQKHSSNFPNLLTPEEFDEVYSLN